MTTNTEALIEALALIQQQTTDWETPAAPTIIRTVNAIATATLNATER